MMEKSPSGSKNLQLWGLGKELEITSLYVTLTETISLGVEMLYSHPSHSISERLLKKTLIKMPMGPMYFYP